MLCRTSLLLALYALTLLVLLTSTEARSRHTRHQLRERERGRHRGGAREGGRQRRRQQSHNSTRVTAASRESEDDFGLYHGESRQVDGITVPSLFAMQTLGRRPTRTDSRDRPGGRLARHDRDSHDRRDELQDKVTQRRPIRGSRKAVVVTQKTYLKKEWCKTQPLKQVVRMPGCLRTKILNNFCYGQCNSFFIPKKARRDKKAEAFMSCGFCRPRRFRWILVTLRCPTGKNGMRFKRKRVQYIKKCRCMAQDVSMPPFS